MNYNSISNKDYELYNNFTDSVNYSNNRLINNKINNYFNDMLNKPISKNYSVINKSDYSWSKFYNDYIEHNLLFIVILIGVVIFLVIRYYSMHLDIDKRNNDDSDESFDNINNSYSKHKKNKYKNKFLNYKKKLHNEKQKILNIIDELSTLNYEDKLYHSHLEKNYNQEINKLKELSQHNINKISIIKEKIIEPNKNPLDFTIKNYDSDEYLDEDSNYYNINKNINHKDNTIGDLYIEPPYN
jgi:hypothetical protein